MRLRHAPALNQLLYSFLLGMLSLLLLTKCYEWGYHLAHTKLVAATPVPTTGLRPAACPNPAVGH